MTAKDRVLASRNKRLQNTAARKEEQESSTPPAVYSGAGRYTPLGAAGGLPTRLNAATGALAIGQPIQNSQGIISGSIDAPTQDGLKTLLSTVSRRISEVRNSRGIQVFDDDPNSTPAYQDFNEQLLYWPSRQILYYWKAGTIAQAGEWVPILQIQIGIDNPPAMDGAIAVILSATDPSLYIGFSGAWAQLTTGSVDHAFSPGPPAASGTNIGDHYVDTTSDGNPLYLWSGSAWLKPCGCDDQGGDDFGSGSGPPTSPGNNPGDRYLDTDTNDLYTWDGSNWRNTSGGGGISQTVMNLTVRVYNPDCIVEEFTFNRTLAGDWSDYSLEQNYNSSPPPQCGASGRGFRIRNNKTNATDQISSNGEYVSATVNSVTLS